MPVKLSLMTRSLSIFETVDEIFKVSPLSVRCFVSNYVPRREFPLIVNCNAESALKQLSCKKHSYQRTDDESKDIIPVMPPYVSGIAPETR